MIEYWHNPRCSKSRAGLALLEERGAEIKVRKYLEDAPSLDELTAARNALGATALDMVRTGEQVFKKMGLSKTDPDDVLLAAMAANPILIERPLAIKKGKAAIGRPPEKLLDLL
ncbi:arsenate reductase (glutaredoxin) [Ruegeria sediminis]|uniref:Arsenate reductase n=1 Tax=Ruegeria sediminis TaxID=2583820 RepID=A0ABY2X3J4_9RHOB|nr:arsenate reductase (glutaredoxin) [Ruegeria sediminis]TMV09658.1 arsenate reductase (glutaredoxin) [Ruegeria sediminis]